MLLDSNQVGHYTAAKRALDKKENYAKEKILDLERLLPSVQKDIERAQGDVDRARNGLAEALKLGNQVYIDSSQKMLDFYFDFHKSKIQFLNDIEKSLNVGVFTLPESLRVDYNKQASFNIGMGGIDVPFKESEPSHIMEPLIKIGMAHLANSSAGYLNVNIYAGFTEGELAALRKYKNNYFPKIKISLLPLQNIEYFPLFEPFDKNAEYELHTEVKPHFFRRIAGAGDYLGATVSLESSINGSMALASHMSPFVLPIGINATLKFDSGATDFDLNCDFTKLFNIEGRNSILTGVHIFDSPENLLLLNQQLPSFCSIKINEGNYADIIDAAKKTIQTAMVNEGAFIVSLDRNSRMAYGKIMEQALGQPYIPPRFYGLDKPEETFPYEPQIPGMFGLVPEFHYAVKDENVARILKLKINKHISIKNEQKIKQDLPVNLCLVYNPKLNAYDRCTAIEEKGANGMAYSATKALDSPECKATDDPFTCGFLRNTSGSLSHAPRRFVQDHLVSVEI